MHGHRHHDRCDTCRAWPEWALDILIRLDELEFIMTTDFTALTAAVDQLQTTETDAVTELQALSQRLAGAGNTGDQAAVDAIVARLSGMTTDLQAAVTANAPAPEDTDPPAGEAPAPTDPAPVDEQPAPVDPEPTRPQPGPGLPTYRHVGASAIDADVWPDTGLTDADGNELYTFSGDTAGQPATAASDEWVVSTPA